ncbi:hypothetical protein GQ42DRAFT_164242 [Ramicandelaber brevisporus]|nr:hypothetical protein GQ42DRAFT_164242 [Ramicandelaber brevisporus]
MLARLRATSTLSRALRTPLRSLATTSTTLNAHAAPLHTPWANPFPEHEFHVSPENGFLPRQDPLAELPIKYDAMESLLQRMSLRQPDGTPGLLATGEFGGAVLRELPFYDVSDISDQRLLTALFRDLTFMASSYLLEPCDINYRHTGSYGLARQVLPRNIAVPLEVVAAKIGAKPFMEYALSYALYNYKRLDASKGLDYNNLALVRGFAMTPDESGFILVHVAMVRHSGELVRNAVKSLDAARAGDRAAFDEALIGYRTALENVNEVMETMWKRSDSNGYLGFRTFIMGSKNQSFFPQGITFEGVDPATNPRHYRGESGANDSMIPLSDNLFQLSALMPSNPLTQTLRDFRSYRPKNHHAFLTFVEEEAQRVKVREFAQNDANSAALMLANLDLIRAFRHRHWLFTKEYIIKHTQHPVATGGSPIVTWLPNQLASVLESITSIASTINFGKLTQQNQAIVDEIMRRAEAQHRVLVREVDDLKKRFPNQERFAQ